MVSLIAQPMPYKSALLSYYGKEWKVALSRFKNWLEVFTEIGEAPHI